MRKMMIQIPQPCHEDWHRMATAEKGRFCSSCQKVVIDFTSMTDSELVSFFKKDKGAICGRFNSEQLDREINIPRKRSVGLHYLYTITLPLSIFVFTSCVHPDKNNLEGKALVSFTEGRSRYSSVTTGVILPSVPDTAVPIEEFRLDSVINSELIKENVVMVKSETMGMVSSLICKPSFHLPVKEDRLMNDSLPIMVDVEDTMIQDEGIDTSGSVLVDPIISEDIIQTKEKAIGFNRPDEKKVPEELIYPNPVKKGGLFTIKLSGNYKGSGSYMLYDMYGRAIQSGIINDLVAVTTIRLAANVSSGMYILKLLNQPDKTVTFRLVVQ